MKINSINNFYIAYTTDADSSIGNPIMEEDPFDGILSISESNTLRDQEEETICGEDALMEEVQNYKSNSKYFKGYNFKEESKKINKKQKNIINYNAANDLSLLASAKKPGQVRVIKARLLGKAAQISKSGLEQEEIAIIIAKIRRVISKADKKLNRLNSEEKLKARKAEAEIKKQIEEAKRLQDELNRRIKKRKLDEENDILEEMKKEDSFTFSLECIYNESVYNPVVSTGDAAGIDLLL